MRVVDGDIQKSQVFEVVANEWASKVRGVRRGLVRNALWHMDGGLARFVRSNNGLV